MKKLSLFLTGLLMVAGLTMSCKKNNPPPEENTLQENNKIVNNPGNVQDQNVDSDEINFDPNFDVYVGGYYHNGLFTQAAWWKNGILHPVQADGQASVSYDIAVLGSEVYLIGRTNDRPCYWRNGKLQYLNDSGWQGWPYSIVAEGTDIYISGRIQPDENTPYTIVVWKVDEFGVIEQIELEQQVGTNIGINKTFVFQDEVYVGGSFENRPCYWKLNNGLIERTDLTPSPGSTYDFATYNNGLYVFARMNTNLNQIFNYGYWFNGNFQSLNLSSPNNTTDYQLHHNAISASGEIHSIGFGYNYPNMNAWAAVWEGTGVTGETMDNNPSGTCDIEIRGETRFISGFIWNKACVWKDGALYQFNAPYSQGRGIVLVQK